MVLKIDKEKISNIPLPYILYSFLLLIPVIPTFNIPIKTVYILCTIVLFLTNKNRLIRSHKIYNLDFLVELLCICYSFYFIPKILKYIVALVICKSLFKEFTKQKKEILSGFNFYYIYILIILCLYPLINTFVNDVFNQTFKASGYITIFRNFLLIAIGLTTFTKIESIKIIIRPLFISSILHTAINLGYKMNLTNLTYLKTEAFTFSFDYSDVDKLVIGHFSSNAILLFIIPSIYYLYKNNYLNFAISYSSIILTGSRAGFVVTTFALIIHIIEKFNFKEILKKRNYIFIFLIIFLAILLKSSNYFQELVNLFKVNRNGVNGIEIRLNYIFYYIKNISINRLLFGLGNNAQIYNSYHQIFAKTEISQLNYIYNNGLIISLISLLTYIRLVLQNLKNQISVKISQSELKLLSIVSIFIFIASGSQEFLSHPINIFILLLLTNNDFIQIHQSKFE